MSTTSFTARMLQAERQIILEALQRNNGCRLATYRELGLSKAGLWNKMARHGLVPDRNGRFQSVGTDGIADDGMPVDRPRRRYAGPLKQRVRDFLRDEIVTALERFDYSRVLTARHLGISPTWLTMRMAELGITRPEVDA